MQAALYVYDQKTKLRTHALVARTEASACFEYTPYFGKKKYNKWLKIWKPFHLQKLPTEVNYTLS